MLKMQRYLLAVLSALFLVYAGAALAHDVSGTIAYSGSRTGRVYVSLTNSMYNNSSAFGVSVVWPLQTTFSVRGLPDGSYNLTGFMDSQGNRKRHPGDPSGSATVNVSGGNVTGAALTLFDPVPPAPQPPVRFDIMPGNGSAFMMWEGSDQNNNTLVADTFNLYWSTDPSFLSSWPTVTAEGSVTGIKTGDKDNLFVQTGMTNDTTYYYVMTGMTGTLVSGQTRTATVTPAVPTGGNDVSGTITASGFDPSGSRLVVILYSDTLGVYYTIIDDPMAAQAFTVQGVPDGSFMIFPFYDRNVNGLVDQGDVKLNNEKQLSGVEVNGTAVSGVNVTVASTAASAYATTQHWRTSGACSQGYNLNLEAQDGYKTIANMSITSGAENTATIAGPVDVSMNSWDSFYYGGPTTVRPAVGDVFSFDLQYSDDTSETIEASVTAVLDDFPTPVAPLGRIAYAAQPSFSWSLATTPSYNYTFQLMVSSQNGSWDLSDIDPSVLSAQYNSDGRAYPSSLSDRKRYQWTVSVRDQNGNEAQTQARFGMGGGVAGTVTDGTTGIGCVQVWLSPAVETFMSEDAWTAPDGTYTIAGVEDGSYKVQFNGAAAGYSSTWYSNQPSRDAANTVSISAGGLTSGIDAVLVQAGAISGRVTNGSVGVAGLWVGVYDAASNAPISSAMTDGGGYYTIAGLAPGVYKLEFDTWNTPYVRTWYNGKSSQQTADTVTVTAANTTVVADTVLASGASITGQVTNGSTGIQNIGVSVCTFDPETNNCQQPFFNANTDMNGNYTISGISAGKYKVSFNGNNAGYVSEWYNDTFFMDMATLFDLVTGSTASNVNAVLVPGGAISGKVTAGGGADLPGVFVYVCKYYGPTRQDCQYGFGGMNTDAGGNYMLSGLPAGQYEVQFQGPQGYGTKWYDNATDQNSTTLVTVTAGMTTPGINAMLTSSGKAAKIGVFKDGIWYLDANQSWDWNGTPADIYGVFGIGLTGAVPVVGDWNGDGKTKIGVYINGEWYLDMNNNWQWDGEGVDVHGVFGVGLPNAIPVTGDWNGDGITEIGIYSEGNWYLDKNHNWAWDGEPTDTHGVFGIGLPNAIPVTGDWNGDGKTEIGIYSEGQWYLDKNQSWAWEGEPADTYGLFGIGLPNAIPVTGDWNGDGFTKIGIYSDGYWYLDTNKSWAWDGTPTDTLGVFGIGLGTVVPVSGNW